MLRLTLLAVVTAALTPKGARLAGVKSRGGTRSKQRNRVRAPPPPPPNQGHVPKVIGVLDFECTCEENTWSYLHEIIEFPVVLVDTKTQQITDSFHAYVRPTENATLTSFCTGLTGIEQAVVDEAQTIDVVLGELDEWLRACDLVEGGGATHDFSQFAFATDGWDLEHFLDVELRRKDLYKPGAYLDRWVDLSKTFAVKRAARDVKNGRKQPRSSRRANLPTMMRHHKLQFEGRLHCGADDARNMARVALALIECDGEPLRVNDALAGVDFADRSDEALDEAAAAVEAPS